METVKYDTIQDAHTALTNSGVMEWFSHDQLNLHGPVVEWMYRNDASPEQAAEHFNVA